MIKHAFTDTINLILNDDFGVNAAQVFERSLLLQYLNLKTKSANKGSKARGAFGNHYAIYVLVEDYIKAGFINGKTEYKNYEGANFSDLFARQRELPFGRKLQNHHLNNRCNDEFRKFFPTSDQVPIIRDLTLRKYWINERLMARSVYKSNVDIPAAMNDTESFPPARSDHRIISGPKIRSKIYDQETSSCRQPASG